MYDCENSWVMGGGKRQSGRLTGLNVEGDALLCVLRKEKNITKKVKEMCNKNK